MRRDCRCPQCNRLLFKVVWGHGDTTVQIKCKCGRIVEFDSRGHKGVVTQPHA